MTHTLNKRRARGAFERHSSYPYTSTDDQLCNKYIEIDYLKLEIEGPSGHQLLTSSFGLLDFVLRAIRPLMPVQRARLRSGPVKIWPFFGVVFEDSFFLFSFLGFFAGCFETSGSMIPRLVPEISPLGAFCDHLQQKQ